MKAAETEVSGYAEDRWTLAKVLSLTFGARLTHQSLGRNLALAPRAGLAYSLAGGKLVLRAGAGLIFGHVPLLAADFAQNQERVITFSSGPFAGEPITLQNVYRFGGSSVNSASLEGSASSPRTLTWNIEGDVSLRKNIDLRFGYFETHSINLFVADPILPVTGTNGFLALENTGSANYQQAQTIVRYRPSERAELNFSYTWSRARGDLNTISSTFIPVPIPVIRPNAYGVQPSDIPNRVLGWGFVTLPKKFVFSPVADIHSGFPYSNFDTLQNYVGVPDSLRFPIYFALDVKLSREFTVHNPFKKDSPRRKIRVGVFSVDVTNRLNPHDVFSNIDSPLFGQFAGFQRRLTGLEIDLTE